eukprot:TRINITY_DN2640_c0_g1_i1.p2 TRINITY_DN2640_c0_g1~~TRINITY_DN2640_c0_g1_i1.p2  ORF type:complete len:65 (-),score=6.37 TRINITY_DN2640_c0_g1_i1:166-360(-)
MTDPQQAPPTGSVQQSTYPSAIQLSKSAWFCKYGEQQDSKSAQVSGGSGFDRGEARLHSPEVLV